MNESSRYVKCEKPKEPKKNQNNGDYREHVFISLLLSAKDICNFVFGNYANALFACGRTLHSHQTSHWEDRRLSRCGHFCILVTH